MERVDWFNSSRQGVTKAVRVCKARHRSVCVQCHAPIVNSQQIANDGHGWAHVQCFIESRREQVTTETMQYSYGEVGHDPPVHMVSGSWIGPKEVRRSQARNESLCGKKLARFRGRPGDPDLICNSCRRISSGGDEVQPVQPVLTQLSTQMEELGTVSDQDYEVQFLPLGSLSVDMSDLGDGGRLQRPVQAGWVKQIAAGFSWTRFNRRPPIVSERADGTRHVIDGQHQTAGARAAGYGPETLVRCHVYRGLDRQQEAAIFREENRDRKSVKPIDLFRARIGEGDPVAVGINALLQSHGWEIGSHGKVGSFAAVMTLENIYRQKDGAAVCGRTLSVITAAWDRAPDSSHSTVVRVVGFFLRQYPDADLARVAQVLRREVSLQPYRIQMLPHQSKAWQETSVVTLRERYNNRLDPSRRLEP